MAETAPIQLLCYTLLCVLVLAILAKLLKLTSSSARHGLKNLPPGPWALPVIGHLHLLLGALPHQAMQRLAQRHGPVMLLRLGHVPTLVLSSPEAARSVMKTHDAVFASRAMSATADIFTCGGENIAFARHDSAHWKALRRLCTMELLGPKRVRSFRPIREEEAARLVRSIAAGASSSSSGIVDVGEKMNVMMNDVIMRVSEAFLEELGKAVVLMSGFNLTDLFPASRLARALGGGTLRVATEVHGRMDSIIDDMIVDHKRAMDGDDAQDDHAGREREDILTTLLRFQRDGGMMGGVTLTDENVRGVLLDLFTAGSETSATTTVWALSELMRNPHIMAVAQSEVLRVLDGKTTVTEEDIDGRLPYIEMVIKETLRLHAPVPLLLPRVCPEPSEVMGYDVPPGTTVLVNVWAIGRDDKSWTDASEFKPERFESEVADYGGKDFRFLPGGSGRRVCPGMAFGVSNVKIALASLLYHFDWKLPGGKGPEMLDMAEDAGLATRRKTPLLLEATPFVL
ncbi:hypothetical protein BRADI_5g10720v3 [Brachypodium distachyon]|uniref:Cytochrome P450 n=1 Tax=Brachypodium distachyon TaxID=15368 RepID=A0A0Q3GPF5_BRADI|nr:hypothetical protein BRADI_5g10720v3 [Brachypodium distachyon]